MECLLVVAHTKAPPFSPSILTKYLDSCKPPQSDTYQEEESHNCPITYGLLNTNHSCSERLCTDRRSNLGDIYFLSESSPDTLSAYRSSDFWVLLFFFSSSPDTLLIHSDYYFADISYLSMKWLRYGIYNGRTDFEVLLSLALPSIPLAVDGILTWGLVKVNLTHLKPSLVTGEC